jgi:hypothetical protein
VVDVGDAPAPKCRYKARCTWKLMLTSTLARNDPGLLVGNDPLSFAPRTVDRWAMEVVDGVRAAIGDGRGRCAQEASVLHLPAMVPG